MIMMMMMIMMMIIIVIIMIMIIIIINVWPMWATKAYGRVELEVRYFLTSTLSGSE